MTALKKEALQIIGDIKDEDMTLVVSFLRRLSLNDSVNESKTKEAMENLRKYKNTLPEDFDYEKELKEALDEKYGSSV